MESSILLSENRGFIGSGSEGNINYMLRMIKKRNYYVNFVMFIFLMVLVVQNILTLLFLIKIKGFAERLDLGWINSDEMFIYRDKIEKIVDEVCRLYIKC